MEREQKATHSPRAPKKGGVIAVSKKAGVIGALKKGGVRIVRKKAGMVSVSKSEGGLDINKKARVLIIRKPKISSISGVNPHVSGIKIIFGRNLKRCRKAKDLSQEELSEKLDISVKHLSSIERGTTFVSSDLLEKLSASLGVPPFRFFMSDNESACSDPVLDMLDRVIEKNLLQTIEVMKADIRQRNS